jgi:hypothetical protein
VPRALQLDQYVKPRDEYFTEWPAPPITQQPVLQNLAITANGIVIFNDFVNSRFGVLDPAANFIREWSVPTANSYPVNVAALTRISSPSPNSKATGSKRWTLSTAQTS